MEFLTGGSPPSGLFIVMKSSGEISWRHPNKTRAVRDFASHARLDCRDEEFVKTP
jgi:hypothetical protein